MRRRIADAEALALAIQQIRALAARRLAEQNADLIESRWVELVHLHVFERDATTVGHRHAVTGAGERVARDAPGAPVAAGRQHHRLRVEGVDRPVAQAERHHAARLAIVDEQVEHHVFVEEVHLVLDRLLIHRLQDHMAGAVSGVARAAHWPLAEVARVARRSDAGQSCLPACG